MKLVFIILYSFLIVFLCRALCRSKRSSFVYQKIYDHKIDNCLEKMKDVYKLVEANRVYFGAYHDLVNVLTGLNLSLSSARDFPGKSKMLEMSERAVLISSFLKNNQIKKDDFFVLDLGEELKSILFVFNYYFVKYSISIKTKIENDIFVLMDRLRFGQVVINIISNAIDSLKEKDFDRLIIVLLELKGNSIFLTIRDNGNGVERSASSKIFEPFFSSKKSKSGAHCGLGLYFVRDIVEKDFGGKIKFKSEEGKGASFIIRLPS